MAFIVETIVGDRVLQLGNEEFVRQLGFRTNWTKCRVAIRATIQGTANIGATNYTIGLCQGTTNTFNSPNTTQYLGGAYGTFGGAGSYLAGPPNGYSWGSNGQWLYRIGSTTTAAALGLGGGAPVHGGGGTRSIFMVDIDKSALTMTVFCYTNSPGPDKSQYDFLLTTEQEVTALIPGTGTVSIATFPGTLSLLDTVSVVWGRSTPPLEISDVLAIRIA